MNMPTVSIFNDRAIPAGSRDPLSGARGEQGSRNAPGLSLGLDLLDRPGGRSRLPGFAGGFRTRRFVPGRSV